MRADRVRFPAGEITLEGLLQLPEAAAGRLAAVAVCHPHPLYGGDMYNDMVDRICRALLGQGIATLRFNFRGTGSSEGEHAGGYGEREDVWAALDYLRTRDEIDPARLGLAGYSFGGVVALNAGIAAGVKALAAVSAPPRMVDFTALQGYEIPVQLIAGDHDGFVPAKELQQLALATGPRTTCTIVPGTDHFWSSTNQPGSAVAAFFRDILTS